MKKILLILSITFLSTQLFAEGFNDNYIQLGYSTSDYKHVDKITTVSGSVEFGNNYLLSGSYSYETGDWNDPGEYETQTAKMIEIDVDKYFPLNSTTDITSSLSYYDWDTTGTTKSLTTNITTSRTPFKADFSLISIGIRSLTAAGFEISLKNTWGRYRNPTKYSYYVPSIKVRNISDSGLESSFEYSKTSEILNIRQSRLELKLIKPINKNFAIGGRFLSVKQPDWTEKGVFVRRSF